MFTSALYHGHQSPAIIIKQREPPKPSQARTHIHFFFLPSHALQACAGGTQAMEASHIHPEPSWENGRKPSFHKGTGLTPNIQQDKNQQGCGTSHLQKAPSTCQGTLGERRLLKSQASSCWPSGACSPLDLKAYASAEQLRRRNTCMLTDKTREILWKYQENKQTKTIKNQTKRQGSIQTIISEVYSEY